MQKIWGDLDHRLSLIQRWGSAHTIHKQTVAEHIFNVERIAIRLAEHVFGLGNNSYEILDVMLWAHHHEDSEALSGDLPTMIKPYFDTVAFEKDHQDVVPVRAAGGDWVRNIVKLADMLDAWWFLCIEVSLGNRYLADHVAAEPPRILKFVERTWPNQVEVLKAVNQIIDDMSDEKSKRHSKRGA